jgi:hypothetical protein
MWPAWSTPGLLVIGGDTHLYHYPWQVLWRDALAAGEFPFWNPYTFSGVPAFANPQAGYAYPPHWALLWLPPIPALNWTIGLHVLLAGLSTAWCAGRLGASKDGQFLSGVAYALGSATVARMWGGHLSLLEASAWLPVATGLAVGIQRRRAVVPLALAVGLLLLAGQPEMLLFALWWLPVWAVAAAWPEGRQAVGRALFRVGVGFGLGCGLAAVQLVPAAALVTVSFRQTALSWDFLTGASLPPWHLLGTLAPAVFGDPPSGTYWPSASNEWHERLLYVGLVPLLAAAWASGRWRWVCWACAIVAVALAFGRFAPWYAWAQAVLPGYATFRIPSKHLGLAALALALAAGLGIPRLQGRRVALVAVGIALFLGAASLTCAQWFPAVVPLLGGSDALANPAVREALGGLAAPALAVAALLLALVAVAALLPPPWAIRAQLLLAIVDLGLVLQPFRIQLADPQGIVAEGAPLREHARAAWVGGNDVLLGNYGPVLRVTQPAGYNPLFSNSYANLVTGQDQPVLVGIGRADNPVLYLLGYSVVIDPARAQVVVYEPAPPQAWVAHCVWPGTARDVRAPEFPRQACIALADATQRQEPVPPGPASVLAERPGWLLVQAEGPGWLVTTQPWYPGWAAWVDGAPATAEVVDGALVGVPLRPGAQTITLRYRPAGLELGILVSLATAVVLVGSWWWDHPRPRVRTVSHESRSLRS